MSENFDPGHLNELLRRFDYAKELAARGEEHRRQMGETLLSFIEVRDSLERLLAAAEATGEGLPEKVGDWLTTLCLIARQFDKVLEDRGVTPIICLNSRVEPGRHQVVAAVESPDVEEDTIVQMVIRGYEWDGEVLRKPSVIVARGARRSGEEI